jgi:hypothetical protein
MSTRFRWATSARMAAGTAVATALVAGTVTAVAFPWPGHSREPVTVTATPAPAASVASCAGPLLALGREAESAQALTVASEQTVTSGAGSAGVEVSSDPLSVVDVPSANPLAITAPPSGGVRTDLAAAGSAPANSPDLRGFAASACTPPLLDSWLVGGSAGTGAADLVLVANPGEVPATVQLTVYGADGAVAAPAGEFVVAPRSQRVVPLAALLIGEELPVVHVAATGAPVQASLQSSLTRTLEPAGVDQVGAIAAPEPLQIIPGVAVTVEPGEPGATEATTVLRLLAPSAATTATVTVEPVDGGTAGEPQTVPLQPGIPAGLELSGLEIGTYTVRVEAAADVLAAAWHATGLGEGSDFAWYPSAPLLAVDSLVAVAEGPDPVLVLTNDDDADVTVTLTADAGNGIDAEVTVPARGSADVDVDGGEVYRLSGSDGAVRAQVGYVGAGQLAAYPVWGSDAAAEALVVHP